MGNFSRQMVGVGRKVGMRISERFEYSQGIWSG